MNPEKSRAMFIPVGAERPFPWRCRTCGKQEVVPAQIDYDAEIWHDGAKHVFGVPRLTIPICRTCGEKVFTEKVDAQISDALRKHLHLLTPDEMRTSLARIDLTAKEAAARLGIAEETLSLWLNETQIQSRAMDNLLRVFFAFPQVRTVLSGPAQDPLLGVADLVGHH